MAERMVDSMAAEKGDRWAALTVGQKVARTVIEMAGQMDCLMADLMVCY